MTHPGPTPMISREASEVVARTTRDSIPQDGFDCVYLYENGREVGCLNGPQNDPDVIARAKHWSCTAARPDAGYAVKALAVPEREAFWLLELVGHNRWAVYTTANRAVYWSTDDVWQAARFNNERHVHDVWRMLDKEQRERWKPTEHVFINKVQDVEPLANARGTESEGGDR